MLTLFVSLFIAAPIIGPGAAKVDLHASPARNTFAPRPLRSARSVAPSSDWLRPLSHCTCSILPVPEALAGTSGRGSVFSSSASCAASTCTCWCQSKQPGRTPSSTSSSRERSRRASSRPPKRKASTAGTSSRNLASSRPETNVPASFEGLGWKLDVFVVENCLKHLEASMKCVKAQQRCRVRGVRGLHIGSGSAMKLCSTRIGYFWLEAAGSGPQQTQGEPPDEKRVHSSRHDRFPKLQSVSGFRLHHTSKREQQWSERSVRRRVPALLLPCHSVEVFRDEFGSSFGRRVILGGY
jgi:hypothetical protein